MDQQFDAADDREDFELDDDACDDRGRRGGFITVHRGIRNHPLVGIGNPVKPADPRKGAASRYEAWQDWLMEAAYCDDREVRLQGVTILLQRGQVVGSLTFFAQRWNWTVKAVRGWKAQLQRAGMITISEGHTPPSEKGTRRDRLSDVITICNYDKYQSVAQRKGTAKGTPRREKGQESNKGKNNNYSPLPLTGQGEKVKAVRDLIAKQAAPSPSPEAVEALAAYNAAAVRHGWVPKSVANLSAAENDRLEKRLADIGGLEAFRRALQAVPGSRLEGDWTKRRRPDLTYVLSTGTANGDLLRGLLDLAEMADESPDPDAQWWADPAKLSRLSVGDWRRGIHANVTPDNWPVMGERGLGYPPGDPRCVVPPAVWDAATVAHVEGCGFAVPAARAAA